MNIYDIEFFRSINNAHKAKSKKETTLYEIRRNISQTYDETIDYQPDTLVDGSPTPLIIMEYHGNNLDRDRIKKIEAPPESTFYLGSKVDCFGLKWLVTEIGYNQEVKLSGRIQLCNYVLKWQDDDGEIINEECVVKRYSNTADGEDATKVITVGDTRRNIFLQFNEKTVRIKRGKRFYIDLEGSTDPKTYKLTDLDRTTYIYNGRGFFNLTLVEDNEQADDRPDLMIANYKDPDAPLPDPVGSCAITYSGNPILKSGSTAKPFKAAFWDADDNPIDTIVPIWELILSPELQNKIVILSELGNEIRLQALSGAVVGSSFLLRMSASDPDLGQFSAEIEIEIGGLI